MTKDLKSIFSIFAIILLFTFIITALVPYQGDDIWLNYYHHEGLSFALSFFKWSYLHHVSRPSDFIAMLLGDDLKLSYSIFAACFTLFGVIVIFILGIGRLPHYKSKSFDGFVLLSIFLANPSEGEAIQYNVSAKYNFDPYGTGLLRSQARSQ